MIHETHTDVTTTKLCYIEDINKAQKYLMKRPLSTVEFDYLYDQTLENLEHILMGLELTVVAVDKFTSMDPPQD
jgi:hypothetical protein